MGVETKRRSVESSVKLEEVVEGVTSLLRNLKDLTVWWYITYNEFNKYGDEISTMLYKMYRSDFDPGEVRVATLEPGVFRRLYYVNADEPFLSEHDDLEGWINLSNITSASCGKLTIYLFKRNDTSVLGVSEAQPSQISAVFEYPPRSFVSVLFFMVNPEVERFLRDLSREHLRSKKNLDALSTWEYVYDRVRVTKVERDIVRPKKLEYGDAVGSALDVSDSQRYRVLSSVSTRTVGSGEDLRRFFTVKLKKAGLNPEYFMTSEFEMAYLMRKLLPRSDVVALLEDASSLLQMVRKVPVLVKAVEQLDDEWFTKQV